MHTRANLSNRLLYACTYDLGARGLDGHQATAHQLVGGSIRNSFISRVCILGVQTQNERANKRSGGEKLTGFVHTSGTVIWYIYMAYKPLLSYLCGIHDQCEDIYTRGEIFLGLALGLSLKSRFNIQCPLRACTSPYYSTGEWLSWTWTPYQPIVPFVTPHGPSCLHFYHCDRVETTDMTLGFEFDTAKSKYENLEALAEHVRKVRNIFPHFVTCTHSRDRWLIWNLCVDQTRGKLLMRAYGFNANGTFNKFTRTLPMHKRMAAVWAGGIHPTDPRYIPTVVCTIAQNGILRNTRFHSRNQPRTQNSNPN